MIIRNSHRYMTAIYLQISGLWTDFEHEIMNAVYLLPPSPPPLLRMITRR